MGVEELLTRLSVSEREEDKTFFAATDSERGEAKDAALISCGGALFAFFLLSRRREGRCVVFFPSPARPLAPSHCFGEARRGKIETPSVEKGIHRQRKRRRRRTNLRRKVRFGRRRREERGRKEARKKKFVLTGAPVAPTLLRRRLGRSEKRRTLEAAK